LFSNWGRGRTFAGWITGRTENLLLTRSSIHDAHFDLSHTLGRLKQRRCTKVRCQTRRINSLWQGKLNVNIIEGNTWVKFMNNLCNLNAKLHDREESKAESSACSMEK
jgi:hypothetical protein